MSRYQLFWAVFVAALAPLFLHQTADPLWITTAKIALCFGMVAWADRREQNG